MFPRFITVEGGEGVGKTTNVGFIHQWLESKGFEVVVTREPGGTPLAEALRNLLLTPTGEPVTENAELLMVFAARAQHLEQVIKPALEAGKVVLCDRFTDATYAYQGAGRGLNTSTISTLENLVQATLRPDHVFLLDAPVTLGLARAAKRSEKDRIELEKQAFFERVRSCYLERAKADNYSVIDTSVTLEEVQSNLRDALERLWP